MDLWNTIQHSFIWSFVSAFARRLAYCVMDGLSMVVESSGQFLDQFFSMF